MTTKELIDRSLVLIREALSRVKRPILAWSAGKDSHLMLHLTRQVQRDIPVLHLRGFADETKHDFAEDEIERLGLFLLEPKPYNRDIVATGDHVEIVEDYRLNGEVAVYFPIEAEPGHVPGPRSHCVIGKLNQPTSDKSLDVDCVFIGARNDDVDPVHGPMPLSRDIAEAGGALFVYPLRSWTEADVWEASRLLNVPQNKARYERREMSANADYFPMCVECLKPTEADSVICPKINAPVYAIGKYLNLEQRREEWRNKFVNLKRTQ
jgi:3'-phosphoadenosine 5'-phosphosulfate sulfotransferase (PAPS reductase)/FAD synthetase